MSDPSGCGQYMFLAPQRQAQVAGEGVPGHALIFGRNNILFFAICCFFAALESLLNLSRVIYNCVNKWDASCWSTPRGGGGITPEMQYRLEGLKKKAQLLS